MRKLSGCRIVKEEPYARCRGKTLLRLLEACKVTNNSIFAAVCLAPIGEELLCRGVCLHFGKKALGNFWHANILQALVFGILHMNWVQGVYAFIIGIFLGILVERYNSLLPGMIVHFIVNFSSSTWLGKLLDKIDLQASLPIGICLMAIPGIILTMVYFCTRKSVIKSE